MAATANWFGLSVKDQYGATAADRIDFVNDTLKIAILSSAATINQDTQDYWDDLVANEISGTGYTAGGITLASKTLTYDGPTNTVRMKAADVVWSTVSFTNGRYAIVYKSTGTNSTSHLVAYIDFGANQSPSAVDFTISFDVTDGVIRAVVS
jgi:hypothetical protein